MRVALGAAVVTAMLSAVPPTALAVPPPPPNPSDSQLNAASSDASGKAAQVGDLVRQLTDAQAQLDQLSNNVELKRELANKALVDLQEAEDAASAAEAAVGASQRQVQVAQSAIETARKQVDMFAAGSYQQGSTVGSLSAYMGSDSPEDVLARAQLLDAVSSSQLGVMDTLQRARTQSANADSAARAAKEKADAARREADQAKRTADSATRDAVQAQQSQAAQTQQLETTRNQAQYALDQARNAVSGLEGQRQAFEQWDAQRQAEEAAAALAAAQEAARQQAAAEAAAAQQRAAASASAGSSSAQRAPVFVAPAPARGGGGGGGNSSGDVQTVINRAMSVLGVPYSWGGGNASGATVGIRDGGVADSYGDYNKVGFDCSGLMVYAFAAAGISLRHYTGYQYESGRQVPQSQMQPGDMIFYGPYDIHHVTMYIGNGKMIEAPESGSYVMISPVRYGGIMPYVVRMF
ncbi:MAG: NlpC/P60 family protein [Mycobacteriaceae bacterium]